MEFIKFIFSSFWIWLGTFMLLGLVLQAVVKIYNLTLRHRNIRKLGYPPNHCDADGSFEEKCQKEV